jgi:hypothetical protein
MTPQEEKKKKKSVVWKYFGFIKAKDGPATKTNLDMRQWFFFFFLAPEWS